MIPHDQAVRTAHRLARHSKRPDELLSYGVVGRLWGLLETAPGAREAYRCPIDATLREQTRTFTPDQLEAAADRLAHGGAAVTVETPREPDSLPPGVVDLADAQS